MLIEFSARNILSFDDKDGGHLSMRPGKVRKDPDYVTQAPETKTNVLRLGLIYGLNSSGKTNLINAISFLGDLVLKGPGVGEKFNIKRFKFTDSRETKLKVQVLTPVGILRYEVILTEDKVIQEKLMQKTNTSPEKLIFERSDLHGFMPKTVSNNTSEFATFLEATKSRIRPNQLVINKLVDDNLKQFSSLKEAQPYLGIWNWFNNARFVFPHSYYTKRDAIVQSMSKFASDFLTDIGIKVQVTEHTTPIEDPVEQDKYAFLKPGESMAIPLDPNFKYIHKNNEGKLLRCEIRFKRKDQLFSLSEESDGIKRLLELLPLLYACSLPSKDPADMSEYRTFFIDELGCRFHPLLTEIFIKKFIKTKHNHPYVQMICTTHDDHLLRGIRRDCVRIAKKIEDGTQIFPFKTRGDGNIANAYYQEFKENFKLISSL